MASSCNQRNYNDGTDTEAVRAPQQDTSKKECVEPESTLCKDRTCAKNVKACGDVGAYDTDNDLKEKGAAKKPVPKTRPHNPPAEPKPRPHNPPAEPPPGGDPTGCSTGNYPRCERN